MRRAAIPACAGVLLAASASAPAQDPVDGGSVPGHGAAAAQAASALPVAATPFATFMSQMRVGIEFGPENYRWQEINAQGGRLLSEHGVRAFGAGTLDNLGRVDGGALAVFRARGYSGRVEYDGQDTTGRFMASRTDYTGFTLEAGGGYRLAPRGRTTALDLLAGISFDNWERDIQGGVNSVGARVSGFVEDYAVVNASLGLGLLHREGGLAPGYLSLGLRRPLYIDEDIVVAGRALDLEPGRKASAYVSYRLSLAPARDGRPFGRYLSASYDSYRFARSPSVTAGNVLVWQPVSHMDVFGLALGFTFY